MGNKHNYDKEMYSMLKMRTTITAVAAAAVSVAMLVMMVGAASASAAQGGVCYKVAEKNTGNYTTLNDETGLCENGGGEANYHTGEYIKVVPGTSMLVAGAVDCFKVSEPKTGNFKDNKCTEGEGRSEYVKVIARPEFKICVRVAVAGTGAWNDSKCSQKDLSNEYIKVTKPWVHIAGEEWCAPVEDGEPSRYRDAECTEEATGGGFIKIKSKFAKPNKFTSTSGAGTLETAAGTSRSIHCKHDSNSGEITGPRTDWAEVSFTECTATGPFGIKVPCKSTKPAGGSGEIKLNKLTSWLVYIDESTKEVGDALSPETASVFTEINCEALGVKEELKVRGSVIGKLTPTNTMGTKFSLVFKQKTGKQEPTEYEENGAKVSDHLETEGKGHETFAWEESGEETSDELFTEEIGEVVA